MKSVGKGNRIDKKAKIKWREETASFAMEGLDGKKAHRTNIKESFV
jgi:hypothetical protein